MAMERCIGMMGATIKESGKMVFRRVKGKFMGRSKAGKKGYSSIIPW
jgi:hypothetical protein